MGGDHQSGWGGSAALEGLLDFNDLYLVRHRVSGFYVCLDFDLACYVCVNASEWLCSSAYLQIAQFFAFTSGFRGHRYVASAAVFIAKYCSSSQMHVKVDVAFSVGWQMGNRKALHG